MSKRRKASILMFGKKNVLKYPAKVAYLASGTGTHTAGGVISVDAAATSVYMTLDSGTNIGTLVGTSTVYST